MTTPFRFVIASNNEQKTQELIECFNWLGQKAISYQQLIPKCDFPQEGQKSYFENAKRKCEFIAEKIPNECVVADDTGMILKAYPDWLGVLTARELKMNQINDADLNQKIIELVNKKSREVEMISTLVAIYKSKLTFGVGHFNGQISSRPRGKNGHGFDLILEAGTSKKTLAELSLNQKMPLLHRTKAIENLLLKLNGENRDAY